MTGNREFYIHNREKRQILSTHASKDGGENNQSQVETSGFGSSLSSLEKSFYGINSEQTINKIKGDIRTILENPNIQDREYRVLDAYTMYFRIYDIIRSIQEERGEVNFKSVASDDNKVDNILAILQNEGAENDAKIRTILTESLHNSTISYVPDSNDDIQEENSNINQIAVFDGINLTHEEIIQQQQIYANIQNAEKTNLYSKDKTLPPVPFSADNNRIRNVTGTDGKPQLNWTDIPRRDVKRTLWQKGVNMIKWKGDSANRAGDRINQSNEIAKDIMKVLNNPDSSPFPPEEKDARNIFLNRLIALGEELVKQYDHAIKNRGKDPDNFDKGKGIKILNKRLGEMRRDAQSLQQLQDFKNRYPKRWTLQVTQPLSETITNYANNLKTDIDVKDTNSYFNTNLEEACFKILRNSLRTEFNLPSMHGPVVGTLNTLREELVEQINGARFGSLSPWMRGGIVKRLAFVTEDLKESARSRDTGNKREKLKKDDVLRAKLRDAIEEFRFVNNLLEAKFRTNNKTFANNAIKAYIELHDGSFQKEQDVRINEDTLENSKEFSKSLNSPSGNTITIKVDWN